MLSSIPDLLGQYLVPLTESPVGSVNNLLRLEYQILADNGAVAVGMLEELFLQRVHFMLEEANFFFQLFSFLHHFSVLVLEPFHRGSVFYSASAGGYSIAGTGLVQVRLGRRHGPDRRGWRRRPRESVRARTRSSYCRGGFTAVWQVGALMAILDEVRVARRHGVIVYVFNSKARPWFNKL